MGGDFRIWQGYFERRYLLRIGLCLRLLSDDGGQDEEENAGGVGDLVARDDARPCTLVVPR
jgi:hypothetical protein